jgi:hypothetical protein
MQFTVKTTASIKLEGKTERIVFDDDIKGFGLRLREGGSRTWIYQYRIGSKQRRMVLGSAKSVPLSVARENAGRLEAKVKLGGDPAMDKETARRSADETFGVLVEQYLAARQSKWRPNTEREVRRHLTKYAKSLHRFPIAAVSQKTSLICWTTSTAMRPEIESALTYRPFLAGLSKRVSISRGGMLLRIPRSRRKILARVY